MRRKTEETDGMTNKQTNELLYASWLRPPRHNYNKYSPVKYADFSSYVCIYNTYMHAFVTT